MDLEGQATHPILLLSARGIVSNSCSGLVSRSSRVYNKVASPGTAGSKNRTTIQFNTLQIIL